MATQALYNKWRGQTFGDILGQEHITTTLQNQIRAGRIGHAYLFTGLRGTGKTSTARIMAKAVNCIGETDSPPCDRCRICRNISEGRALDLIEIDSASNRGIDEIRALRDKVAFSPNECRYKVYVIDEVHMLTNEAFNALLKTLEEPPSHVIFILCTTEPHRLPETVLSRCQRFDFRRGSVAVLLGKLRRICDEEHIAIAPDALEYIARRATGSFRDAESLLDQLAAYGANEITLELVQGVLGSVPGALVARLVQSLVAGDVPAGLRAINQAIDDGAEPRQFLSEILDHLRALMLLKVGSDDGLHNLGEESMSALRRMAEARPVSVEALLRAVKLFNEAGNGLRNAARPQLPLEMAFIEASLSLGRKDAPAVASGRQAAQPGAGDMPQSEMAAPRKVAEAVVPASGRKSAAAPAKPTLEASPGPTQPVAAAPPPQDGEDYPELEDESDEEPAPAKVEEAAPGKSVPQTRKLTLQWVQGNWRQALLRIRPLSPQVQALLNSAAPVAVKDETITIGCINALVCEKLKEEKKRDLVERVLSQVMGMTCRIQCVVQAPSREPAPTPAEELPPPSDIFSAPVDPHEQVSQGTHEQVTQGTRDQVVQGTRDELRQKLLNHPAVKELEKRGGQVAKVSLADEDEQEDDRG